MIYIQCKNWTRIKQGPQFSEQSQSKVLTERNNRDDVSNTVKIKESIINDFFSFRFLTTPLCDRQNDRVKKFFYLLIYFETCFPERKNGTDAQRNFLLTPAEDLADLVNHWKKGTCRLM